MKVLTISIAAYNCELTLNKCLDSLVRSKRIDNLEIIIVNDGSKDGTIKIAREYENKYPQSIIVIDKENGGHGSTINTSITKAQGKYYKILDSDDWVETQNLDKLVELLERIEDDLVINPYYEVDYYSSKKKQIFTFDSSLPLNSSISIDVAEAYASTLYMHELTFRTSVVKQVGPIIDEHCFYVDTEYVAFSLSYVQSFRILKYPIYNYLLGNENQSVSLENRIKRRKQHLIVSTRLFEYYESIKCEKNRQVSLFRKYSTMVVRNGYNIFLALPIHDGKNEFIAFDRSIPKEIFSELSIKYRALITVLRWTNYHSYLPIISILKVIGIVENYKGK